ncbi:MAG: hypothetical protein DYG94_05665 [Leptolyngbya sp. PLA3]|nr:MAG: hypothetical protein EDM82_04455 [Cyanobacteria bacterium CYA]MCE7968220.1 hypothetical protein [Leptolyngbya sp. PL-A3]
MSPGLPDTPALRLVGAARGEPATSLQADIPASPLEAGDARWILAVRVAAAIEGERAAVLTPEKRERLLKLARLLGLRDFDAALIIAIIQDSARCGLGPLADTTAERIAMVRKPQPASRDEPWQWFIRSACVSALGALGAVFLVRLFGG